MNRWWKVLVIALLIVSLGSTWLQVERIQRWANQGARFTAQDGQALCERVKALEAASYGFRDAGKAPLTCNYLERK